MEKLPFAILLASAALLVVSCVSRQQPLTVEIRPVSGEQVALRVNGGDGLKLTAHAYGLGTKDRRLAEFTAPGTLEIAGGEGELQLSTADTTERFLLTVKVAGGTRELETQGQWAVIRMRDGKMKVEAESMTMREVRAP